MPYDVRYKNGKWETINTETNKVKGTHSSKAKALRQMRLLYMIEGGKQPTGAKAKS